MLLMLIMLLLLLMLLLLMLELMLLLLLLLLSGKCPRRSHGSLLLLMQLLHFSLAYKLLVPVDNVAHNLLLDFLALVGLVLG